MNIQPALPQIKVQLDWKAYYQRFSEKHGGTPVVYKGRQLFQDGWTYALEDYAGPEWPPPSDPKELCTLQTVYWYTRWNRAKNELLMVRQRYDALKGLQDAKDAPLQQVVTSQSPDNPKKLVREVTNWSPLLYEHVISFLESEVEESDRKLKALKQASDPLQAPISDKEHQNGYEVAQR